MFIKYCAFSKNCLYFARILNNCEHNISYAYSLASAVVETLLKGYLYSNVYIRSLGLYCETKESILCVDVRFRPLLPYPPFLRSLIFCDFSFASTVVGCTKKGQLIRVTMSTIRKKCKFNSRDHVKQP